MKTIICLFLLMQLTHQFEMKRQSYLLYMMQVYDELIEHEESALTLKLYQGRGHFPRIMWNALRKNNKTRMTSWSTSLWGTLESHFMKMVAQTSLTQMIKATPHENKDYLARMEQVEQYYNPTGGGIGNIIYSV